MRNMCFTASVSIAKNVSSYQLLLLLSLLITTAIATSKPNNSVRSKSSLPGRPYESNDMLDDEQTRDHDWSGGGREFDLFDTRGGNSNHNPATEVNNVYGDSNSESPTSPRRSMYTSSSPSASASASTDDAWGYTRPTAGTTRKKRKNPYSYGSRSSSSTNYRSTNNNSGGVMRNFQDWWLQSVAPGVKNWPKLQIRVEPTTTIKIRKTFRPLKTIVRLGADFNYQLGVWQFKSSWEDDIIGGKLTLSGGELQLTKSWQLSVGAMEDLVTRLRFRAAVDLGTMKAYARVGFRTERLSPINFTEGFTIVKRLPIVAKDGKTKLEVKANFALPEPEIEYSTENSRSMVGMGDIEVNIEELNLVLDY